MAGIIDLLGKNRNYRYMWLGQVVSEIGDHFNNIAVFSLAMHMTGSGMVITGVMLSRAVPAIAIGPIAGIVLDRLDRKKVMIASDLVRAAVAIGFIFSLGRSDAWILYALSALLMAASPFFTGGRASILPSIASKEELHTANSVTQTTQWTTIAVGAFLGGASVAHFGYEAAFVLNAVSFSVSAFCIWKMTPPAGRSFRAERISLTEDRVVRPWHEYVEGLRYMRSSPLILAIGLVGVGWATGGGAAQILFSLFGEVVFQRGAAGIGEIWGSAGLGLVVGGYGCAPAGKADHFPAVQMDDLDLLHRSRIDLRDLQPDAELCSRTAVHCDFESGSGGKFGAELFAASAACQRSISGTGVCDDGDSRVVDHDAFDDGSWDCIGALLIANDRRSGRSSEQHDGGVVGLGELDGATTGTAADRGGPAGSGDPWRSCRISSRAQCKTAGWGWAPTRRLLFEQTTLTTTLIPE
jgi:MFS family permease